MQMIYAHDRFLPADTRIATADDRSFRFGDGLFETVMVANGQMYDLPAHIARLQRGLEYFRLNPDLAGLKAICEQLIEKNNCASGYVRIIVSRGENGPGAIGYMPGETSALLVVQTVAKPFPAYGEVALWVSEHRAHLHLPSKVNSAMLYTLAMMEAREHGCGNALILDMHGHVCETASANLFWVKDGVLFTPELSLPFVPGTVRARLIELSPLPVKEGRYRLEALAQADEIFMTNIGGLVTKISAISPLGYQARVDEKTRRLRDLIVQDISSKTQG